MLWADCAYSLFDRQILDSAVSPATELARTKSLYGLVLNFEKTAKRLAAIIVEESGLPVSHKSVKPVNVGGIAGGEKVCICRESSVSRCLFTCILLCKLLLLPPFFIFHFHFHFHVIPLLTYIG